MSDELSIRFMAFHRSLLRPVLFMGCDRELILLAGLIAFALAFAGQTMVSIVYGIFLWVVALFLFRKMARNDPLMRQIYMRHRRYKRYYSANSTPYCASMREYK